MTHKTHNSQIFSRRSFLTAAGASAGLFFLPSSVFADSPDDVVLRAAIVSDVHYKNTLKTVEAQRFERMLEFVNEYSAKQTYNKFDVLMIVGDMSDNGKVRQSGLLRQSLKKGLKPETKWVFCMGNHDHWGGNRQIWEELFEQPANKRVEINGYQFITLSCERGTMKNGDYEYALPWLKEQLDAACADNTNKPVFLIQHYPIFNTIYGSCPPDKKGTTDLCQLLKNYPRLIDFAGHSHFPTTDPRSAWQGEFTAFGTGSMSYFRMRYGKLPKPNGYRNAGFAYIMEIHADNSVVLKVYDAITNKFFDCVYVVTQPGNIDKFIYTNKRYQTSLPPFWQEDAKASVDNITSNSVDLTFPQAKWDVHENIVHSYRIDIARMAKDATTGNDVWIDLPSQYEWSQYFFNDMPDKISISCKGLEWNTQHKYSITALNCFDKESKQKLTGVFSTLKDPEECVDQSASTPEANVLNVYFNADGPINAPVNKRSSQNKMEVLGAPKYALDETVGAVVGVFDGKHSLVKVPFSEEDAQRLSNEITFTVKFKLDKFESRLMSPFGAAEHGGYAFRINGKKKRIEAWIRINDEYHKLKIPIEEGKYYSATCVYDGRAIIGYLNGVEKAREYVSGHITYSSKRSGHAFCVGSDISGDGMGEFHFPGSVVYARVYSWALTHQQVQNISR